MFYFRGCPGFSWGILGTLCLLSIVQVSSYSPTDFFPYQRSSQDACGMSELANDRLVEFCM